MKHIVKDLLEQQEKIVKEYEEKYIEEFNPCELSGGNFDDAYQIGYDDGFESGKLTILRQWYDSLL